VTRFADGPQPTRAEPDDKTGGALYRGLNGNLVLTDRGVVIRRGIKGFLLQGGTLRGDKEIPYDSIVALQFKNSGINQGYLQLSLRGGSEAKAGLAEAIKDENTISFGLGRGAKFSEARDIIRWRIDYLKAHPPGQPPPARNPIGEISELAALRDSGAITEAEYTTAKRKILDRL